MVKIGRDGLKINGVSVECELNSRLEVVYKDKTYAIVDFLEELIDNMYSTCIDYERYMFFKTDKCILRDKYKAEKLLKILESIGGEIYIEGADYKRVTLNRLLGGNQ